MSSIIGHCAAGVSVFLAYNRFGDKRALRGLPVFAFLAICPDFDYLPIWLFNISVTPRISHSLLFCLAATTIVWWISRFLRIHKSASIPFIALFIACVSHIILDLLVGVHPVPVLFPLANSAIVLPIGILPSAGRLAIGNYYLWRNLLIELAILLPTFAFFVTIARQVSFRAIASKAILIAPIWLFFLIWSVSLPR